MPPRFKATILVWNLNEKGQEQMMQREVTFCYSEDLNWVAQQYAEVNNGLCNIMNDTKILAKFDARG